MHRLETRFWLGVLAQSLHLRIREVVGSAPYLTESNLKLVVVDYPTSRYLFSASRHNVQPWRWFSTLNHRHRHDER